MSSALIKRIDLMEPTERDPVLQCFTGKV